MEWTAQSCTVWREPFAWSAEFVYKWWHDTLSFRSFRDPPKVTKLTKTQPACRIRMNLDIRKKCYINQSIKCWSDWLMIIPGRGKGCQLHVDPENALVGTGEVGLSHLGWHLASKYRTKHQEDHLNIVVMKFPKPGAPRYLGFIFLFCRYQLFSWHAVANSLLHIDETLLLRYLYLLTPQYSGVSFRIRTDLSCWKRIQEGKNYPQK